MNEKKDSHKKTDIDALIAQLQRKRAQHEKAAGKGNITPNKTLTHKKLPKIKSTAKKIPTPKKDHGIAKEPQGTNPIAYICFLLTLGATLYIYLIAANAALPNWDEKIQTLEKIKIKEAKELNELKKSYISYNSLINKLTTKKPFFEGVLKELAILTPKSTQFTSLHIKDTSLTITGLIEKEGDRQRELKALVLNLASSPFFHDIKIKKAKHIRDKNITEFVLEGGLNI